MPDMIYITENDKSVFPSVKRDGNVSLELAPMIYTLDSHPERGVFFKPLDNFNMPKKIYGEVNNNIDRYFRSYELNDKNVGIALIGKAGSGKTITLKQIANKAVTMGMPVILINEKRLGSGFVEFLASIKQQCVICFDEVDKTYVDTDDKGDRIQNSSSQNTLITLLDGAIPSAKKMFIFTLNDKSLMSSLLFGRPSRIRYVSYFKNLETSVVADYVQENLKSCTEEKIREFIHLARSSVEGKEGITFDTMAEYVSEMNQFNESLDETIKTMNGENFHSVAWFTATVFEEGKEPYQTPADIRSTSNRLGSLEATIKIGLRSDVEKSEDEAVESIFKNRTLKLSDKDFLEYGASYEEFVYQKDGIRVNFRYTTSWEHTEAQKAYLKDEVVLRRKEAGEEISDDAAEMVYQSPHQLFTQTMVGQRGFSTSAGLIDMARKISEDGPVVQSSVAMLSQKHLEIRKDEKSRYYSQTLPRMNPEPGNSDDKSY